MAATGFVIAAPASGSGKTTLSVGLMRALHHRGLRVQPYKCGPDYIDTQFHAVATGRVSFNLDTFMSSPAYVRRCFAEHMCGCDVAVVEGAMGLFDGYDGRQGSAAHIASLLGLPVVLVVDARSMSYTLAPLLWGLRNFSPDVNVVGVVLNKVGSARHRRLLIQACSDAGLPCLGCIGRVTGLDTPSRHLGLTLTERERMDAWADAAAEIVERDVDLDALLGLASPVHVADAAVRPDSALPRLNVAVACDEAFCFCYPANMEAWLNHPRYDVRITGFSPIRDGSLPPDTDFVYLPGGYPELYADLLSRNRSMIDSVRRYASGGKPMLAECGGLIYLCNSIDDIPMAGVLPMAATMRDARLTLGYRRVMIPYSGMTVPGHEFHYSHLVDPHLLPSCASQSDATGREVDTPLYRVDNVLAGYTHLFWPETDIFPLWNL